MPFFWSDLLTEARLSAKQRILLEESREHGMRGGISIPVHGPLGDSCVISLARSTGNGDDRALIAPLHILGVNFFLNFWNRLGRAEPKTTLPRLTERERECLTWSANGKSAWAISQIIGVSENTVNFHLKSAMKKLGTSNRVQAVAIAVRAGLIHPS
jgi:LuxR family quorum-sensing system transcriptional regulator CciR